MQRHRNFYLSLALISATLSWRHARADLRLPALLIGNYTVSGPIRVELNKRLRWTWISPASADAKSRHGAVRASGFAPRVRKNASTIARESSRRTKGRYHPHRKRITLACATSAIAYSISSSPATRSQLPTVASGAQTIRGVRGP